MKTRKAAFPPRFHAASPIGILISLLATGSTTVSAQEIDAADDATALEEIIISATRREASLQSVPLSVSVITPETLRRHGAAGFLGYAGIVPGLSFTDQGVFREKQTIRGISTGTLSEINPTTAMYLDEVPLTNAGGNGITYNPDPAPIDIERVEVLRGPQGTLFGAGAMGGAIRIITHKPDLSRREGFLSATVSSTRLGGPGYRLAGMLNAPLSGVKAAIRVVGYHREKDGFIDNLTTGIQDANNYEMNGGRLAGTILLSEHARLTGRIIHQRRTSDASSLEEPENPARVQSRREEPNGDEWTSYNLVLDAEFKWGNLVSSTSFLDRNISANIDISAFVTTFFGFENPLIVLNRDRIEEFVQEMRIFSDEDTRLRWLGGIFYQDQEERFNQNSPSPGFDSKTGGLASRFGAPDDLWISRPVKTSKQLALYGEASYGLTDRLNLIAGIRWFDIARDHSSINVGLLVGGRLTESGSADETGVTPKFGLSFAATDDLTVYGTASKGFRSGGVNPTGLSGSADCRADLSELGLVEFPLEYESDSLWSYELGLKSLWDEGRLQLNGAIYHVDWSDIQTLKLMSCGAAFIENAGEAISDGVELEIHTRPTDDFDLRLGVSYNIAELEDDAPNLGGVAGDRIPGVPGIAGNLGATWYISVGADRELSIHGSYRRVGSSFSEFNRAVRVKLAGYDLLNLRMGLTGEQWSGAVFIQNVLDERGILTDINDPLLGGHFVTATPPRTVGVSAEFRF